MNDYISPGLSVVSADEAFPGLRVGDAPASPWIRWWIEHDRYSDPQAPKQVFTTRDEAAILHDAARHARGKACLQIGGGQDWSGIHIALGSRSLDIVDAAFRDTAVLQRVEAAFAAAGVGDCVRLHPGTGTEAGELPPTLRDRRWQLVFLHGSDIGDSFLDRLPHLTASADANCLVLVSDLASPYAAAVLRRLRDAGWHIRLYQTMQVMGVAWRGIVEPPAHVPDPNIAWTLPRHLLDLAAGDEVDTRRIGAENDERGPQRIVAERAQRAQDEAIAQRLAYAELTARVRDLEARTHHPDDGWSLKAAIRKRAKRHSLQIWMKLRSWIVPLPIPPNAVSASSEPQAGAVGVQSDVLAPETTTASDSVPLLVEAIKARDYPLLTSAQQVAVDARLSLGQHVLTDLAIQVRQTELFDEVAYRAASGLKDAFLDAAQHYVMVGEIAGIAPSSAFDPRYYARRNPDVRNSGMVLVVHYAVAGRGEKRLPVAPSLKHVNPERFSPARENVIVVAHEASRTGAPILGWNIVQKLTATYNVFSICLGGGPLVPEFQALSTETYGPFGQGQNHWVDLDEGLQDLFRERTFRYAIVNSTESRPVIDVFVKRFVPTFFLVHEYAFYVFPPEALRRAFNLSTEVIFPTKSVSLAAHEVHPALAHRSVHVIPQGRSVIPSSNAKKKLGRNKALEAVLKKQAQGQFIVLGAGSVNLRKGVDLFLAAAAAAAKRHPARPIHFAWVGHGYKPDQDMGYSIYLREQLRRSGLETSMTFVDEVADMEPLYKAADVLLLTSRLDPLPNVSIDAACEGMPVVCFREASGTAEIMLEHADTAMAVVPHLDADAAADLIVRLACDQASYDALAAATAKRAGEIFDMGHYVAQLDALWPACVARMENQQAQTDILTRDPTFDTAFFLEPGEHITQQEAVSRYVAAASLPGLDMSERRPSPGFSGNVYRDAHPELPEGLAPFTDFVKRGRPTGPWQLDVLCPAADRPSNENRASPRCCLYVARADNRTIDDILTRITLNHHACDLVFSTDEELQAELLRDKTAGSMKGRVQFVVRDGGTDSADFPVLMNSLAHYDVIGCLDGSTTIGDADARLDWGTLIGSRYPMMDRILAAFTAQPDLGLVFAANPNTCLSSDAEYRSLVAAAEQLKLPIGSRHYEFPQRLGFWVRNTVLRRLTSADLSTRVDDGMGPDQTLRRLLPLAVNDLGARQAVAHVPELH